MIQLIRFTIIRIHEYARGSFALELHRAVIPVYLKLILAIIRLSEQLFILYMCVINYIITACHEGETRHFSVLILRYDL